MKLVGFSASHLSLSNSPETIPPGGEAVTDYVLPKLTSRVIPVTKDCDRQLSLTRKGLDGSAVNWGASVYILVDIDKAFPTKVDGVVVGPTATITIEASVANQVRTGTGWRIVMSQSGTPTTETPIMIGTFERNDK